MHLRFGVLIVLTALSGCGRANSTSGQATAAPATEPGVTPALANNAPLPVSVAKHGFTSEQLATIRAQWRPEALFKAGDQALLYMYLNYSEFYPSARIARDGPVVMLEQAPDAKIGAIQFQTARGQMSLDEYLVSPNSRAQGMIVVHQGKIAFETYPGMRDHDSHITMSVGKTTISLVIALLEAEGKVDVQRSIGSYVPELTDTTWNEIKVIDVLDMASGLDVLESKQSRDDVTSAFGRYVQAIFNRAAADGKVEKSIDVIRSVKKLREPGEVFQYSSLNSHVLVLLAEAVEHRPWPEIFQQRVWSKVNAEGDLSITVSPDGTAVPAGFIAIRLRDLARYGMLYTPSWSRAAREQVVSAAIVKKIQSGGRAAIYPPALAQHMTDVFGGDTPIANSRQWDAIFADGDFFKSGMHGQGLYVSPAKDLVIAWFSIVESTDLPGYARAIARSYSTESDRQEAR